MNNDSVKKSKFDEEKFYKIVANRYVEKDGQSLKQFEEMSKSQALDTSELDNKFKKSIAKIDPYYFSQNIKGELVPKEPEISKKLNNHIIIVIIAFSFIFLISLSFILNYNNIFNKNNFMKASETNMVKINVNAQKFYDIYLNIKLGMTLDEVKAMLNNSFKLKSMYETEEYKNYTYINFDSTASLYIEVDKDNKIIYKKFYDDKNTIFKQNAGSFEKSNYVINGMTYNQIKELFGCDGYNFSVSNDILDGGYVERNKIYAWVFNDNSKIEITFSLFDDKEVVYYFKLDESNKIEIKNSGVNYDNFKKIKSGMSLDVIKSLLNSEPVVSYEDNMKEYVFDGIISVGYENHSLSYKSYNYLNTEFPNTINKVSLEQFYKIERGITKDELELIIGSEGLLSKEYFNDNGSFNKSYTWIFEDSEIRKGGFFTCIFDKENKLLNAGSIGDELSKTNHDENLFNILNNVKPEYKLEDFESLLNKKALITISDFLDSYYISFKYLDLDFNCLFYINNQLCFLSINIKDYNLLPENGYNSSKIQSLRNDMTYDDVKNLFKSEGYISYLSFNETGNETKKSYTWIFNDKKHVTLSFDSNTNKIIEIKM